MERTIAAADRAKANELDVLGGARVRHMNGVNWHMNVVAGKQSPLIHWSRIDELDSDLTGDKRVICDLNRHQHFTALGQAYWYTSDEDYAKTFVDHVTSWMDQNPPQIGVNWLSSLELAYRAISWLWALEYFRDSPSLDAATFASILGYLHLHGRHIQRYLSTYFSPNTHLTGEALGLYYLGTMLPDSTWAAGWRATGRRILIAEVSRQVRPDGVYFEQSSHYHRYTVDIYTHFRILATANGDEQAAAVDEKLEALLDVLLTITRPDGSTPLVSDDDGGRVIRLDGRPPTDCRSTLSTGALLFDRPDYKYVSGGLSEETLWLLGVDEARRFDSMDARPPHWESRGFRDGGYYIMRDGWLRDSHYMMLDCGPHGALTSGHAHADALAFDLAAYGRTMLVDTGTCTYTGSASLRDAFRTSPAHNVLTVDRLSSSVPGGAFSWRQVALATLREWLTLEQLDYFDGEHDGYVRLEQPVIHRRSVLFVKRGYWMIRDRASSAGSHIYDVWHHFAPDAMPDRVGSGAMDAICEAPDGKPGLCVRTFAEGGGWVREEGLVSECFGGYRKAVVWRFQLAGEGPQDVITFLLPRRASGAKVDVIEIAARGGRAFELRCNDFVDRVILRTEQRVECQTIVSDYEWVWMRSRDGSDGPSKVVAYRGRELNVGAQRLLEFAQIKRCASVSGGEVSVMEDVSREATPS